MAEPFETTSFQNIKIYINIGPSQIEAVRKRLTGWVGCLKRTKEMLTLDIVP